MPLPPAKSGPKKVVVHDADMRALMDVAHLVEEGNVSEASSRLGTLLQQGFSSGAPVMALARWRALEGDAPLALSLAGVGLAASPELANAAREDKAFACLRDHPAFLQMVGAL